MNDRKKLLVSLTTVIQVLEDIGCAGVFNEIELKDGTKEKIDCVEEIIKYIDNDLSINPYEFEDLKVGMWVYDIKPEYKEFAIFKITKILTKEECEYLYKNKDKKVFFDNRYNYAREFEEGRYFPVTKAMEEFEDDN